ncbi:hypothetical protein GCM10022213_10710 [Parerythrobacter jejuensis]
MKTKMMLVASAALVMAGCSGEADDAAVDAEELAEQASEMIQPQAGQYQTTAELVEFEVPGMSDEESQMIRGFMEQGFTQQVGYCLTPEDAEKGFEEAIRKMRNDDNNKCEFTRFDVSSGAIDSEMKCDDGKGNAGTISMAGKITETSQDLTMTLDQQSADLPRGSMKMKMKMSSERVGECS